MWSGIVDSFTYLKMEEEEAIEAVVVQHIRGAVREAKRQLEHADNNTERWLDFLETMTRAHGADDVRKQFGDYYAAELLEGAPLDDWKKWDEEEADAAEEEKHPVEAEPCECGGVDRPMGHKPGCRLTTTRG
jgi:hypothetical protein